MKQLPSRQPNRACRCFAWRGSWARQTTVGARCWTANWRGASSIWTNARKSPLAGVSPKFRAPQAKAPFARGKPSIARRLGAAANTTEDVVLAIGGGNAERMRRPARRSFRSAAGVIQFIWLATHRYSDGPAYDHERPPAVPETSPAFERFLAQNGTLISKPDHRVTVGGAFGVVAGNSAAAELFPPPPVTPTWWSKETEILSNRRPSLQNFLHHDARSTRAQNRRTSEDASLVLANFVV